MANESISLGKTRYSSKRHCLCPKDCGFIFFTLTMICGPTGCSYYLIIANENAALWVKLVLIVAQSMSLIVCLWALLSAAFTEPGIIPPMEKQ